MSLWPQTRTRTCIATTARRCPIYHCTNSLLWALLVTSSDAGNGSGYVLGWLDGNATGIFAIGDIQILRLNSALVNVIRTGTSDINVTSEDGATRYELGKRTTTYIHVVSCELE
jgi:hypothetical protein